MPRVFLTISLFISLLAAQTSALGSGVLTSAGEPEVHCEVKVNDSGTESNATISEGLGCCDSHDCESAHSCCLQNQVAMLQETFLANYDGLAIDFLLLNRWASGYLQNPSPPPKFKCFSL